MWIDDEALYCISDLGTFFLNLIISSITSNINKSKNDTPSKNNIFFGRFSGDSIPTKKIILFTKTTNAYRLYENRAVKNNIK